MVVQRYSRKPFLLDLPDQDDPKEEGYGGRGLASSEQGPRQQPLYSRITEGVDQGGGLRHHVHTLYVSPYRPTPLPTNRHLGDDIFGAIRNQSRCVINTNLGLLPRTSAKIHQHVAHREWKTEEENRGAATPDQDR